MAKNDVFYINMLHQICYEWLNALQQENGQVANKNWRKEYYALSNKPVITDADREQMKIIWQNMAAAQEFEDIHAGTKKELLADRVYAVDKMIEKIADDFFRKEEKS